MLCPNFNRRKNGINKGDKRTVIKNAMANVTISIIIFTKMSPSYVTTVLTNLFYEYFSKIYISFIIVNFLGHCHTHFT